MGESRTPDIADPSTVSPAPAPNDTDTRDAAQRAL